MNYVKLMRAAIIGSLIATIAASLFVGVALMKSPSNRDTAPIVAIPVLLALSAALAMRTRAGRLVAGIAAAGLLAFAILSLASIGMFYLPGAVGMLIACSVRDKTITTNAR